jgi:hypothetical protein
VTNHAVRPHTDNENIFNGVQHEILTEILFLAQIRGNGICSRDAITNMEDDKALATTSQSKSGQEESGTQFQLQFVTTVSVNVPSKAEKKRNQKIIRQTVMKNFRQQQRSEKSQPKGKVKRGVSATSSSDLESGEPESDEPSSSASSASGRSQSNCFSESDRKKEPVSTESRRSSCRMSQNSSDLGSPLTPLGAGRVDPFRPAYAESNPHMHELIDHCK